MFTIIKAFFKMALALLKSNLSEANTQGIHFHTIKLLAIISLSANHNKSCLLLLSVNVLEVNDKQCRPGR